jgi:capsular exopolysaccharide synthesis family protein
MSTLTAPTSSISASSRAAGGASGGTSAALPAHYRGEQIVHLEYKKIYHQLVSLLNPDSPDAERYRRLRYSVERLRKKGQGIAVGLTSPVSGDGKTLTSINLAGALAQNPANRVLLIELDLRQPLNTVKNYLGARKLGGPGVVDMVIDETLPWEKATYYMPDFNLYLLPSGSQTRSPYELLTSERMGVLLQQARQRFDYVIVDTAPVVLLPDSQLIADWIDGFMIVLAANVTSRKLLEEALALLDQSKVLGLVFNGYTPIGENYGGYY